MRARLQDKIAINRKGLNEELTAIFIALIVAPAAGYVIAKNIF